MTGQPSAVAALASEGAASLADRVLGMIRDRAASAEAEVLVHAGTLALTRFANSAIHQNVAEDVNRVSIRLALDGRVASSRLDGRAGELDLSALVDGVFAAARVSPVDPDWPGVAGPTAPLEVEHWDEETAAASPADRANRVAAFVAAADGLETAGALSTEAASVSFVNTAGQAVGGRGTVASIDGIARTGTSDGVARWSSAAIRDIDGRAMGERAGRAARDSAKPGEIEPGRYEVVLSPSCVADVVGFLLNNGFAGRAVEERRSFVQLGELQLDRAITIRQDVTHRAITGVAFDAEGTPRTPIDLVRDGVSRALLHDRRTAHKAGASSTGNAVAGSNQFGSVSATAVLVPGESAVDELVRGVERGIFVSDFWYTRVLDPRTLVVTGLTRNGVWLIEDGRVGRAVQNLRFTQSYPDAVAPDGVRGVGSDSALFPDGLEAALLVPSLRLASWNFTGGAKG
jgi:predicted Zn-dependent protease